MRKFMETFNASEYVKTRGSVQYLTSEPFDYMAQFTYTPEVAPHKSS